MPDEDQKPRKAVAIRYDANTDQAPKLVAKGQRLLADRIVALAKENDIHVHEDPELVGLLSKLDVDAEIPAELYEGITTEITAPPPRYPVYRHRGRG